MKYRPAQFCAGRSYFLLFYRAPVGAGVPGLSGFIPGEGTVSVLKGKVIIFAPLYIVLPEVNAVPAALGLALFMRRHNITS